MRLWHTSLISVLPREQLVSQWRECSSIAGAIQKNGTPNHLLVNFVLDYDYNHFISYAYYIRQEITKRGYRTMDSVWNKIVALKPDWKLLPFADVYPEKMDDTYLEICSWNLYEKYICGGISNDDMVKIKNIYTKKSKN
jgi:uncharacterized protein (TIGR02328 family)